MCNEAENMKGNCPSVKKKFQRNSLPDTLVENCSTDLDSKRWAPKKAAEV